MKVEIMFYSIITDDEGTRWLVPVHPSGEEIVGWLAEKLD